MFKKIIKSILPRNIINLLTLWRRNRPLYPRQCPICGFKGKFTNYGRPPQIDGQCPKCESAERHRLFWLWLNEDKNKLKEPILHFAPETALENKMRLLYINYKTADLFSEADIVLNIEAIELNNNSIKTVICNHVLEHVDDKKALAEIYRVLTADGCMVVSVPIIEGWSHTYENPNINDPFLRTLHFGEHNHVRYYGRDFRDRLKEAGFFNIQEITAEGKDVIGLHPCG